MNSNEELNMYIQLYEISAIDIYEISKEDKLSVVEEIMYLAKEKNLLIGYYFLMYLDYLHYIELEDDQHEMVYCKLKEMANTDYYLDKEYRKLAKEFSEVFGFYYDFCHYALQLPLFLSVCEYKKNNKISSTEYLQKMISDSLDYEIKFEEKILSPMEENYIFYELARRMTYGEGAEINIDKAWNIANSVYYNCKKLSEKDSFWGYIFEEPSKKTIYAKDLILYCNSLQKYLYSHRQNQEVVQDKMQLIKNLKVEKDEKNVEEKNKQDWDKVNQIVEELNAMQGLSSVKRKVNEILAGIRAAEYRKENFDDDSDNLGTMHMIFTGNAGTGKTTVARMIGKIYGALGIIKNENLFVECSRADLVGEYLGHTAPKVKGIIESAIGGVLFIDEAYSLTDGGDAFGTEAINTLIAEVENHRKEIIVILAGYKDKMQEFLKTNQGLASRFSTEIYFDDYEPADMLEIIKKMAKDRNMPMSFKPEAEAYLKDLFRKKSLDKEKNFGNARGVRNVFEDIIRVKDARIAEMISQGNKPSKEETYIFELEDVIRCPECSSLMNVRKGPYGRFMSCKNFACKYTMSVEKYNSV